MKNLRLLSCLFLLIFASGAYTEVVVQQEGFAIPVGGLNSQVIGSTQDEYVPPPPLETAVLGGFWSMPVKTTLYSVSLVGVGMSLALSAGGIGLLFTAAGNGFDAASMHNGIFMAASGALFVSLFSMLLEAAK